MVFLGGRVDVTIALIMAIGAVLGALVGANFVRAKNNHYIQWVLKLVLFLSVLSAFYDIIFK